MRKLITLLALSTTSFNAIASETDTLKNHAAGATLQIGKYTTSGDWGFYAGHNSNFQQQFGEKYKISEHADVLGVVAYIGTTTGTVSDNDLEIDFKLWGAKADGSPTDTGYIEDGHIDLGDVTLGGPTVIMFHSHAHVDYDFFVTMDLGDYLHDGLGSDTVGLYHTADGTRTAADISSTNYRNIFQAHSHSSVSWKDFYTQFTTPTAIATHFAIYPIVEMEEHSSVTFANESIQVSAPYPNPCTQTVNIPYYLNRSQKTSFTIMDIKGKVIERYEATPTTAGQHTKQIDISKLPTGIYNILIAGEEGAVAMKISKM
jgi:hypothetical protein